MPLWADLFYWAAIISNAGPLSAYIIVMIGTVGGMSLPHWATIGARMFFLGCAAAHLMMMIMMIAMPMGMMLPMLPIFAIGTMLGVTIFWNVVQTVGALMLVIVVARRGIRTVSFKTATDAARDSAIG